jgi:hypothetical protein
MRILPLIVLATLGYYSTESCTVRSDTATAVAYALVQPRTVPQPRKVVPRVVPGEEPGVIPTEPPQVEPPKQVEPPPAPKPSPECDTGVCVPRPATVPVRRFGWRIFRR